MTTVTAFEATPIQSQPDALDPRNLPITGTGTNDGRTVAYTHTVADRQPIEQPDQFDRIVAGQFPGEENQGMPSYVARVDRAGEPTQPPHWHAYVAPGATPPPAETRPASYVGRHEAATIPAVKHEVPRDRWYKRIGRHVADLAIRLTGGTHGTEAVASEGIAEPGYLSRHKRNAGVEVRLEAMTAKREKNVADKIAYAEEQPLRDDLLEHFQKETTPATETFIGVAKVPTVETPATFTGRASVTAVMASLQHTAEPAAVVEAPAPVEPIVPEVQTPGTDLVLFAQPAAEAKPAPTPIVDTAAEALVAGLNKAGFDSVDAFRAAVETADAEGRSELQKVLYKAIRVGKAWHPDRNSNPADNAKFDELHTLIHGLAADLGIHRVQQSDEEKARAARVASTTAAEAQESAAPSVKLDDRTDLNDMFLMMAARRKVHQRHA